MCSSFCKLSKELFILKNKNKYKQTAVSYSCVVREEEEDEEAKIQFRSKMGE